MIKKTLTILVVIVMLVFNASGCSAKTLEEDQAILEKYCVILQEKAREYSVELIFEPIKDDGEGGRMIYVDTQLENIRMSISLYRKHWNNLIFVIRCRNFETSGIDRVETILLSFSNLVSTRQFQKEDLQEFMKDDTNITQDTEVALMKAKYFDFESFEGIIYENQKIAGAGIEMLGIMGKLKPLES